MYEVLWLTMFRVSRKITHLVASTSRTRTHKVRQAAKYPNIKIVNQQWLFTSMSKWQKEEETPYLVSHEHSVILVRLLTYQVAIHEADRIREEGFNSSAPSSVHDSEESSDDSATDDEDSSAPASSQDDTAIDEEGVMPDDIEEGGTSPIEKMKDFDWGTVDDELNDFMGSDSESNDSGTESDASKQSSSSKKSARGRKRSHDVATDEDDSDEESTLAKKQRIANSRTTGLKTVKTPNAEPNSLPTPSGDDGGGGELGSDDGFGDLEADLEAEFAREAEEDGADEAA